MRGGNPSSGALRAAFSHKGEKGKSGYFNLPVDRSMIMRVVK
jgi:hypothetical protein